MPNYSQAKQIKQNYNVPGTLDAQGVASFHNVVNLAQDPATALEAATKQYVDTIAQGLTKNLKEVRVATTANIADLLAADQTQDGVVLAVSDRVLVKDQTNAAENGVYEVTADNGDGTVQLVRAADADESSELAPAAFLFVMEGSVQADYAYVIANDTEPVIDTDPINFTIFSRRSEIVADGVTIEKVANQLSIVDGGVGETQLADNAVTDLKIGDRTVDGTTAVLSALLQNLADAIKGFTGKATFDATADATLIKAPAVASVTATENSTNTDLVDIVVTEPADITNVDFYEVFRDGKLVQRVAPVAADGTINLTDKVNANGSYQYDVYAVHDGIPSGAVSATANVATAVVNPADVVLFDNANYFDVRYTLPANEKLEAVEIYVAHSVDGTATKPATPEYTGLTDNYAFLPEASFEDDIYQVWVDAVTRTA